MEVLLNLDLVPLNTDSSVGDGKSLLLLGGLNLNLHDSLLEESNMEIKVGSTEVDVVLSIVLVLMEMKTSMDRILMDGEGVWHNIVSCQQVVSVGAGIVSLGELGESGAEVGGLAAVWDLWDMGLVLSWVEVTMVEHIMVNIVVHIMVNIVMDIMETWMDVMVDLVVVSEGNIVRAETVHLGLEEILSVQPVVGVVVLVGTAGLNESKSEHQKRFCEHR